MLGAAALAAQGQSTQGQPGAEIPKRPLGRTGLEVSALGIGGYHLGSANSDAEATQIVNEALDAGVNFFDNAWEYHQGLSEERLGRALKGKRDRAVVMTKVCTHGRDKSVAMRQLEESLTRLQTDHLDVWQIHEVIYETDPDLIFVPNGAAEALLEAKKQGKARFVGFTGHKDPSIHLKMLSHNFPFDTVQMPINVMDAHFRSFLNTVVPVAQEHGTAILAMKTFGDPYILQSKTVTPLEALHFGLNSPASVVITGIDSPAILNQAFHAVESFKPLDRQQVAAILAKTKEAAMTGKFELFKTSSHYDGTIKNPSWLGYTNG